MSVMQTYKIQSVLWDQRPQIKIINRRRQWGEEADGAGAQGVAGVAGGQN